MLAYKWNLIVILLIFIRTSIAQIAVIPKDNLLGLPADDLVYNGSILVQEDASYLESKEKNYLSKLNPEGKKYGLWDSENSTELIDDLDKIDIKNNEVVKFNNFLKSDAKFFKFQVFSSSNKVITLYADKTLHTTLLRKNLLRKLGYKVSAIKYLPSIKVKFSNKQEKVTFISKMLRGTEGRPDRWIENETDLTLTLRDIAAQKISEKENYNIAMGLPTKTLSGRAQRALVLPYSLLDLPESVNKFNWSVGRVGEAQRFELPHFVINNNFASTTYNDLLWIGRRISKFDREDFQEIVAKAYFPEAVSVILVEKLISRAVSLFELLNIDYDKSKFVFDTTPTYAPFLLSGQINKLEWFDHGYATEFAGVKMPSPFKDFQYFIYSMLQSVAIDSIVAKANTELRAFDPNDARLDLAQEEFEKGLNHFVETGEFLEFPVSAWATPVVNGNVILSRDIVVGNYLGTENRVQLADTFGYAISLGGLLGLENIDFADQVVFNATANYVKTFTHLQPLKSLKDVFKRDYKNMMVPLLKENLSSKLKNASDADINSVDNVFLNSLVASINDNLAVGESLLITEKVLPKIGAKAKIPLSGIGGDLGLGASYEYSNVSRIQIFRKSSSVIQIFDDKGYGNGFDYEISLNYKVPLIRFENKSYSGRYTVKSYTLNLEADKDENPYILDSLSGFRSLIEDNSTEILDALASDGKLLNSTNIKAQFDDNYSKFSFLFWRNENNKGFTDYQINSSQGLKGNYVTYHDSERSGMNWESFLKDIINYKLSTLSETEDIVWANRIWGNPANSILGNAKAIESRYEAGFEDDEIAEEYMSLTLRYEGWSEGRTDLLDILYEINDKFTVQLFDKSQIQSISKLYMYDIETSVQIYEDGIDRLRSLTRDEIIIHASDYDAKKYSKRGCNEKRLKTYKVVENGNLKVVDTCGSMRKAIFNINRCSSIINIKENSKCWLEVAKSIFKSTTFDYFSNLIGENNYYVSGKVNGFRKNSEILNDTIFSKRTLGRRHPEYPNGLILDVQMKTGLQAGELRGEWLRERP